MQVLEVQDKSDTWTTPITQYLQKRVVAKLKKRSTEAMNQCTELYITSMNVILKKVFNVMDQMPNPK